MRDYLSPAKKVVERVLPEPASVRNFVYKKRAVAFIMAASFVVITTLGFVTVRAIANGADDQQNVVKEEGKTSTLSTTPTNSSSTTQPEPTQSMKESTTMTTPSNSNEQKTEVKINNEKIAVPENGSVHRTITNENGTTQVNVSTNSDSTGNTYSSSFSTNSTNMNSSMSSSSQSINITTQ